MPDLLSGMTAPVLTSAYRWWHVAVPRSAGSKALVANVALPQSTSGLCYLLNLSKRLNRPCTLAGDSGFGWWRALKCKFTISRFGRVTCASYLTLTFPQIINTTLFMEQWKSKYKSTPASSGRSSPTMEKSDSVLNLVQPPLYAIYNTSSVSLNKENEEVEEYIEGTELHINAKERHKGLVKPQSPTPRAKTSPVQTVGWFLTRLIVVAVAAFAYNEVTKNIHAAHSDGNGARINAYLMRFINSWKPFQWFVGNYHIADQFLALALEGLLLSFILPALDNIMPLVWTKRLLSSSPDPYRRSNLANDIIRSLIAFLGISYAIRHIEWQSSLQMAMAWSIINPALWLLLDGTINGFMASFVVAFGGSAIVYMKNGVDYLDDQESTFTTFLFIASFFFCGVIIFGKLGRYLFGKNA